MRKILFIGRGSKNDPGFDDVLIEVEEDKKKSFSLDYKEYMQTKGITIIDEVIESCHGCYDIMTEYSRQMQSLVENGDRVVAVLQGGLFFALPSMQATQVTFPIISCPIDLISYQGFMVPSGHAVVATVGIDRRNRDGFLEQAQRAKALTLAEKILNLDNDEVNIIEDITGNELIKEFDKYGIESCFDSSDKDQLAVVYGTRNLDKVYSGSILIRSDNDEDFLDWDYLKRAEMRHYHNEFNIVPTAQIRGLKNLVIYVAKIISLQRDDVRDKIKEVAIKKYDSYEKRNLLEEIKRAE